MQGAAGAGDVSSPPKEGGSTGSAGASARARGARPARAARRGGPRPRIPLLRTTLRRVAVAGPAPEAHPMPTRSLLWREWGCYVVADMRSSDVLDGRWGLPLFVVCVCVCVRAFVCRVRVRVCFVLFVDEPPCGRGSLAVAAERNEVVTIIHTHTHTHTHTHRPHKR